MTRMGRLYVEAQWEVERAGEPSLRWVCARCHLLSAEHREPWWSCEGRWVDLCWEQKQR
jgi:hypothetical protein